MATLSFRQPVIRVLGALIAIGFALPSWAVDLEKKQSFEIAPQPITSALLQFAAQAKVQLISSNVEIKARKSPGVNGEFTLAAALERLLSGTGLRYRAAGDETIVVTLADADASATGLEAIRVAQEETKGSAGATSGSAGRTDEGGARESGSRIEEIIVTAQKRSERIQDVPVPVSVVSGSELVGSHQMGISDYYTKLPGLNVAATQGYGGTSIAIRGLSTGANSNTAATVAIMVDDVQYSGSGQGVPFLISEIDPTDVAQVEVLRGPQGTLYGANSLGGLIKYVTVEPSTSATSGVLHAGMTDIKNGDEVGYSVSGAVNVPLGDTTAIRASAFTRQDPGYIDDPTHNRQGVNSVKNFGGRLVALWAPSEDLSLKLGAYVQDAEADGISQINQPGTQALEQNNLPDSGGNHKKVQLYTANLNATLGRVDFKSITAYADLKADFYLDANPGGAAATGNGALYLPIFGVTGALVSQYIPSTKFTQELRFGFPLGDKVDLLLGGYYSQNDKTIYTSSTARNYATGALVAEYLGLIQRADFEEYSAFGNLTVHMTDRFDVQFGARQGRFKQNFATDTFGRAFGNITTIGRVFQANDDAFTYLVTPRFKVSEDLMFYSRLASGYRPGGPNTSLVPQAPPQYGPDKTQNYEVGAKGTVLDGAVSFDASLYYIEWNDIQVSQREPVGNYTYTANAGKAKSQGVELSVESHPFTGMSLDGWVAYNDAELTEDFPSTTVGAFATAGERLPLGSRTSGSISLDQEFKFMSSAVAFVGGSVSYVGERFGNFRTSVTAPRARFPSYIKLDLHAGVRYQTWDLNLFANNLTDKRAILDGDAAISPNFTFIQPRLIGMAVSRKF